MKNDTEQLPLHPANGTSMAHTLEEARKCVSDAVKHITRATARAAVMGADPDVTLSLANASCAACSLLEQVSVLSDNAIREGALDSHREFVSNVMAPAAPEPMDPAVIAQLERANRFGEAASVEYDEKGAPRS